MQNVHQLQRKKLAINIYTSAVDAEQIILNTNGFHIHKCNRKATLNLQTGKAVPQLQPAFQKWEGLLGDRCSRDFDLCVSLLEGMDAIAKKKIIETLEIFDKKIYKSFKGKLFFSL